MQPRLDLVGRSDIYVHAPCPPATVGSIRVNAGKVGMFDLLKSLCVSLCIVMDTYPGVREQFALRESSLLRLLALLP